MKTFCNLYCLKSLLSFRGTYICYSDRIIGFPQNAHTSPKNAFSKASTHIDFEKFDSKKFINSLQSLHFGSHIQLITTFTTLMCLFKHDKMDLIMHPERGNTYVLNHKPFMNQRIFKSYHAMNRKIFLKFLEMKAGIFIQ